MKYSFLSLITILLFISVSTSAQHFSDGYFSDWQYETPIYEQVGNVSSSSVDIERVYVWNDDVNIYFRFDLNKEIDLLDERDFFIIIDADQNTNTGFYSNGLGAEITYNFEGRNGYLNFGNSSISANHFALGLLVGPTVTSDRFEFSMRRSQFSNSTENRLEGIIDFIIADNRSGGDSTGKLSFTFDESQTFTPKPYSLTKVSNADFRLMSYNVEQDNLFAAGTGAKQKAIIKAMNPDIIAFQEIYDHSATQVANILNDILPKQTPWTALTGYSDVMLFSYLPIEATEFLNGNEITLLYPTPDQPIVIVNVHFPCCDNDDGRQQEIDNIMSVLRDKDSSSKIDFEFADDTPFLIVGDFNLVGDARQYETLITGDIKYNSTYGSDFDPDIDGSRLDDVNPYMTGLAGNQTWVNPDGGYASGKLDFCIYSGSKLKPENSFVLNTSALSQAELTDLNLSTNAVFEAADHLPVIVDFSFGDGNTVSSTTQTVEIENYVIAPNPGNGLVTLTSSNIKPVNLRIVDSQGKIVHSVNDFKNSQRIDLRHLDNGVYFINILDANYSLEKTILYRLSK